MWESWFIWTLMSDTDAHQGFGLEVTLRVENQSRIEGDDLDRPRPRRVGDDFTAGSAESVQCCGELPTPDREEGTTVSRLSVEIEIESCLDSPLTWRIARRSNEVGRYEIACVIPHEKFASVVARVHVLCSCFHKGRWILNSSSKSALWRPTRSNTHRCPRNLMKE